MVVASATPAGPTPPTKRALKSAPAWAMIVGGALVAIGTVAESVLHGKSMRDLLVAAIVILAGLTNLLSGSRPKIAVRLMIVEVALLLAWIGLRVFA